MQTYTQTNAPLTWVPIWGTANFAAGFANVFLFLLVLWETVTYKDQIILFSSEIPLVIRKSLNPFCFYLAKTGYISVCIFLCPTHITSEPVSILLAGEKPSDYHVRRREYLWFMSITDIELNGDAWHYPCILLRSTYTCVSH